MQTRLKEFREAKQLSQRDLAKLLHTSEASICRWEAGDLPTLIKLERAARVLGVRLIDMFSDVPETETEMASLFAMLPRADQEELIALARLKASRAES